MTCISKEDSFRKIGKSLEKGAQKTGKSALSIIESFIAFINKGNVVDLAVGIVIGAAFTAIVNSFVTDLITPFIGLLSGSSKNLENLFLVLKCPDKISECTTGHSSYATILEATTAGAVTWYCGSC